MLQLVACGHVAERNAVPFADALPSRWTASPYADAKSVEGWLDTFGDAALTVLVHDAVASNFDLRAAAARVEAARAQARIEGAGRKPQLQVSFQADRARYNDGQSHYETGGFDLLFGLSWELDVWGRIAAAQRGAEYDAESTAHGWDAARLSLAGKVAQAYFALAEARLQAEVAEQSIADRRVIVELVRGRFGRGLTKGLDLSLALTDLANAEAQLAEARNEVQLAARRLETLLGRYPSGTIEGTGRLPELTALPPVGLPSELVGRRPDVVAAFDRLHAQDSRLDSARKALLPRFTLSAAGGAHSPALDELADPRSVLWNAAAGLMQPLLTGGLLRGQIERNAALAEAALNDYRQVLLTAFREVEQALAAEDRLRARAQALAEAVRRTEDSRRFAVYSYRYGFIEILTLLDSYRSTLSARSEHLAVKRRLLENRINLFLALGGGYDA